MPPRTKSAPRTSRPVTITAVVDPVAALGAGTIDGSLYLYDTNRTEGSTGFGTLELRTRVHKGDTLLWNALPLECETFVALVGVDIDRRIAEPVRQIYPGTDIAFWTATVKQEPTQPVAYRLSFLLGAVAEPFIAGLSPYLVGSAEAKERK